MDLKGGGRFLMSEVAMYHGTARGERETCIATYTAVMYRGTSLIRETPPWDPTVALCLGTSGDPRVMGVSYERGTPVCTHPEARMRERPRLQGLLEIKDTHCPRALRYCYA